MTLAFENHNHDKCRHSSLQCVEDICQEKSLKLTPMRKRVLEMLLANHQAMGAYELLGLLTKEGEAAQPPIVYRALAFLTENGFAHKIEKLNAYIACHFPERAHSPGFLICKKCAQVGECCIEKSPFQNSDFQIDQEVMEAEGTCGKCVEKQNK